MYIYQYVKTYVYIYNQTHIWKDKKQKKHISMYIKVLGGRQNIYEQICSKARYRREDSCAPTESFWEVIICDIWPFIFRKGIAHPWVFISHGPPLEGPYHRAPCHSGPFKALGNAYPRYSRPLAHGLGPRNPQDHIHKCYSRKAIQL